jgi:AraC family ethanolamine operon transcriptional activator
MLLVSMQADQALLVEGTRHPRWLPFTVEHTDNYSEHRHFGESLAPYTLAGFNTKMTESLMRTSPGGNRIGVVLVDRRRIDTWVKLIGTSEISERMEHNNTAIVSPAVHRELRQLMVLPPWQGVDVPQLVQADLLEAQLIESLSPESSSRLQPVQKTHHSDLVKELIRFSFQSSTEPISLAMVCQTLFTTKTTLTVSCREMFGYGPSALMRRIRLQQVREVLCDPDLRQRLRCHTVQQVAEYFGFPSRNHFASAYRELFAEAPRTTLLASR